jgi:AcrR family transcriptional regulator
VARKYDMAGRTAAKQHTREAILDAVASMADRWYDEVTLGDVARVAGVSQQTVVNHFGSKLNLYLAAVQERFAPEVETLRSTARPGDTASVVGAVMADYEVTGDRTWRFVTVAQRLDELRPAFTGGRQAHREYLESVLGPRLARPGSARRESQLARVVVLLDVATWWQLRRADGRSAEETTRHLVEMVDDVLRT